jgi:biotin/methionine sulfoxide reductase
MTLEREDIGGSSNDPLLVPMKPVAAPFGEARDDYAIFSELADRLGTYQPFTEGRTVRQWLEHLYEPTRTALAEMDLPAPSFDAFWASDGLTMPQQPDDGGRLRSFRSDPAAHPLSTPSGKIEIFSTAIASYQEPDCPGHPSWLSPTDVPSPMTPLTLVANQPATCLHSQFDGPSMAERRLKFWAICGVTLMSRNSLTKSAASNPLSPPRVIASGLSARGSIISSAASRSA